jgi:hypothetical protein
VPSYVVLSHHAQHLLCTVSLTYGSSGWMLHAAVQAILRKADTGCTSAKAITSAVGRWRVAFVADPKSHRSQLPLLCTMTFSAFRSLQWPQAHIEFQGCKCAWVWWPLHKVLKAETAHQVS